MPHLLVVDAVGRRPRQHLSDLDELERGQAVLQPGPVARSDGHRGLAALLEDGGGRTCIGWRAWRRAAGHACRTRTWCGLYDQGRVRTPSTPADDAEILRALVLG